MSISTEGTYKVITPGNTFVADVSVFDGTSYGISYGDPHSPEGACVYMSYEAGERLMKLDSIVWAPRCAASGRLERGAGTRDMLASVLRVCFDSFPSLERICFNDVAAIPCQGRDVTLSYMSLCRHGQTWYERHFGARPAKRKTRDRLAAFRALLGGRPCPGVFSFFSSSSAAATWHEFFAQQDCAFFLRHQEEIQRRSGVHLMYSPWYIPRRAAAAVDVRVVRVRLPRRGGSSSSTGPRASREQRLHLEDT